MTTTTRVKPELLDETLPMYKAYFDKDDTTREENKEAWKRLVRFMGIFWGLQVDKEKCDKALLDMATPDGFTSRIDWDFKGLVKYTFQYGKMKKMEELLSKAFQEGGYEALVKTYDEILEIKREWVVRQASYGINRSTNIIANAKDEMELAAEADLAMRLGRDNW